MASVFKRQLTTGCFWVARVKHPTKGWIKYNTKIPAVAGKGERADKTNRRKALTAAWDLQAAYDRGEDPIALEKAMDSGIIPGTGEMQRLREQYLQARARFWESGTLDLHARTTRLFVELMVTERAAQIKRQTIDDFVRLIRERGVVNGQGRRIREISPEAINIHLRNLKTWFRWIAEETETAGFCVPRIRQEKTSEQGRPDYYSPEECRQFLTVAMGWTYWVGHRGRKKIQPRKEPVAPFFLLLMATGLREGETLALRWPMLDERKLEIRLPGNITKRGKAGTIPIPAFVLEFLLPRKALHTDRIFDQWLPHGIRDEYEKIAKAAGLRKIKLHNLRDTFAQNHIDEGVPLHIVSALLRHSSVETTIKNYLFVGIEEMRRGLSNRQKPGTYENALREGIGLSSVMSPTNVKI